MLHLSERVLGPVLLGGAVWLYGIAQRQGTGFRLFVLYFAIFSVGIAVIIATMDLMPKWWVNNWPLFAIVWAGLVGFIGWKRHLT